MNSLLFATASTLLLRLGIFAFLHVKYREFSIFKNTISDYGTGKSRQLYSLMSILSIIAYIALFTYLLLSNFSPLGTAYILAIAAIGSIAILFFPTDRTGDKVTRSGRIHWLLAIVNFAALFVFMTNAQIPAVSVQPEILVAMTWIVRITFYMFLASLVLPKLRRHFIGLTERLFLIATPVWFITFAVLLIA
ncbi:DUF998 domain-containing protein [Candidatus Saccharibacteria bacterium]|nr:DUF998 domain-containing protein [Candidatus Saccharibacteria bacterium]